MLLIMFKLPFLKMHDENAGKFNSSSLRFLEFFLQKSRHDFRTGKVISYIIHCD
jgi:hypothetical protein